MYVQPHKVHEYNPYFYRVRDDIHNLPVNLHVTSQVSYDQNMTILLSIVLELLLAHLQAWLREASAHDRWPLQHASVFLKSGDEGLKKTDIYLYNQNFYLCNNKLEFRISSKTSQSNSGRTIGVNQFFSVQQSANHHSFLALKRLISYSCSCR